LLAWIKNALAYFGAASVTESEKFFLTETRKTLKKVAKKMGKKPKGDSLFREYGREVV
jgi:hypothetical protein